MKAQCLFSEIGKNFRMSSVENFTSMLSDIMLVCLSSMYGIYEETCVPVFNSFERIVFWWERIITLFSPISDLFPSIDNLFP